MLKVLLGEVDLLSGGLEQAAEYLARAPSNSTKRPAHPSARHYQWSGWPRSRSPAGSGGARTPAAAGASPGSGQPSRATSARARPRQDDPGRPNLPRSIAAVQRADTAPADRDLCRHARWASGWPPRSPWRVPVTSNKPWRGWRRPSGSPSCGRAAMARRHLEGSRRAPPLRRRPHPGRRAVSRRPPNSSPRPDAPSTGPLPSCDRSLRLTWTYVLVLSDKFRLRDPTAWVALDSPRKRTPSVKQLSAQFAFS